MVSSYQKTRKEILWIILILFFIPISFAQPDYSVEVWTGNAYIAPDQVSPLNIHVSGYGQCDDSSLEITGNGGSLNLTNRVPQYRNGGFGKYDNLEIMDNVLVSCPSRCPSTTGVVDYEININQSPTGGRITYDFNDFMDGTNQQELRILGGEYIPEGVDGGDYIIKAVFRCITKGKAWSFDGQQMIHIQNFEERHSRAGFWIEVITAFGLGGLIIPFIIKKLKSFLKSKKPTPTKRKKRD